MANPLAAVIPGISGLTSSATGVIQNALSGLPSPSESRLANAYYGAGSGMDPTSDFLRNRGYDLYKTQANQRQQQGIQDLLGLVGGYTGAAGQNLQNTQFGQSQAQQASQFGQNLALQQQQLASQNQQAQQQFDFEKQQYDKSLELLNQYLGGPSGGTGGYSGYSSNQVLPQTYLDGTPLSSTGFNGWMNGAQNYVFGGPTSGISTSPYTTYLG